MLRNYVFLYALEKGLPLPIGTQDAEMLDPGNNDEDADSPQRAFDLDDENGNSAAPPDEPGTLFTPEAYRQRAAQIYEVYRTAYQRRFKWIRATLFNNNLKDALKQDAEHLIGVLQTSGAWQPDWDRKLKRLYDLLTREHPDEKVLIFTQFADTVHYLAGQLQKRGLTALAGATGQSENPTALAWRFSPISNEKKINPDQELRILIATDVLSEGQNLQDAHIVVNYDLPWAIIRLVQRAGRVDRIGQSAPLIKCYSFLPAEGVERIIRLRSRVRQRLQENGEVIGTDEQFFEDERNANQLRDLFTEKSGILDDEADSEVDLASYAYQIWHDAIAGNPVLEKKIADMPDVVLSTRAHVPSVEQPTGVLVYLRTAEGADALAWVDWMGNSVTQSQLAVLRAAECQPDTPTLPHQPEHHDLVKQAVEQMMQEARTIGGQLGRPSGARYKTYTRLKAYHDDLKARSPLFAREELQRALDDVYRYPLREGAKDVLNRQLKAGVNDEDLADVVINLRNENRLSLIVEEGGTLEDEARIICSLGLATA